MLVFRRGHGFGTIYDDREALRYRTPLAWEIREMTVQAAELHALLKVNAAHSLT